MLDQVRPSSLVRLLHQRSCIDTQTDGNLPRRHTIATHGEAETILQRPELPARIAGNIAAFVKPGAAIDLDRRGRYSRRARGSLLCRNRRDESGT